MNRLLLFALAAFVLATGRAQTTVAQSPPAPTSLTLSSSGNPVVERAAVTFKATVQPIGPSSAKPSGRIEFIDGATSLGTADLSEQGSAFVASLSTASLSVGPHPVVARYSGDPNFAFAVSAPLMQFVTALP